VFGDLPVPFGDPLSLFTLILTLAGAGLYLRMVGREKDRRERHILLRYYEMGEEEDRKAAEARTRDESAKPATGRKPERSFDAFKHTST
jgi:hypothetical protein